MQFKIIKCELVLGGYYLSGSIVSLISGLVAVSVLCMKETIYLLNTGSLRIKLPYFISEKSYIL